MNGAVKQFVRVRYETCTHFTSLHSYDASTPEMKLKSQTSEAATSEKQISISNLYSWSPSCDHSENLCEITTTVTWLRNWNFPSLAAFTYSNNQNSIYGWRARQLPNCCCSTNLRFKFSLSPIKSCTKAMNSIRSRRRRKKLLILVVSEKYDDSRS